ncbi:MAG: protease complex subunit PrcB family protein [Nitrospirota bacterium]
MKKKKLFLAIVGIVLFIVNRPIVSTPLPPIIEERELVFKTIEKGYYSGHDERRNYAIINNNDWKNLWDKVNSNITPKPFLPEIDFSRSMIVAVFQGAQGTGGYAIDIVKVVETENTLEVFVKEMSPGRGCGVTFLVTQPYHIIEVQRVDKKVIFIIEKEVKNC